MLALWAHWIDEGLVAIAQVDGAPLRGNRNLLIWPCAIRQFYGLNFLCEVLVAPYGHGGTALLVPCGLVLIAWAVGGGDVTRSGDKRIVGGHGGFSSLGLWLCVLTASCGGLSITALRDGALAVKNEPKSRRGY